jgi:hypothetical protein
LLGSLIFSVFLSNFLSDVHQSNAQKILSPLLLRHFLRTSSSETNTPDLVPFGSLNKKSVLGVQQHLLELVVLCELEIVAAFHNTAFDSIPDRIFEFLDIAAQSLLSLWICCDENFGGGVCVIEGLGFVVHHVLLGAVELDVRKVGISEGTFFMLREDAVRVFSCAEEVDWLGSVFGDGSSHDVDVDVVDGVDGWKCGLM